jgi:hypothetical protein
MNGQWTAVEVRRPYLEGYAWAGLLIVYAYDEECGCGSPYHFEIWHHASGELMLEVNATLERTQEIATDLANIADWAALTTTDEMMLHAKLMAFGMGYPGEVTVSNDWAPVNELDRIVPYGMNKGGDSAIGHR